MPGATSTLSGARRGRPVGRAFSLLELVLVVVIISTLAAMAVPRFGNVITRSRAQGAARRIAADLALVQQSAMTGSVARTFRLLGGADPGYELLGLAHPDRPTQPYVVSFRQDCHEIELVSYDFGGDSDLIFDMYGVPDTAARIIVRAGAYESTLNVDAQTGVVSIKE